MDDILNLIIAVIIIILFFKVVWNKKIPYIENFVSSLPKTYNDKSVYMYEDDLRRHGLDVDKLPCRKHVVTDRDSPVTPDTVSFPFNAEVVAFDDPIGDKSKDPLDEIDATPRTCFNRWKNPPLKTHPPYKNREPEEPFLFTAEFFPPQNGMVCTTNGKGGNGEDFYLKEQDMYEVDQDFEDVVERVNVLKTNVDPKLNLNKPIKEIYDELVNAPTEGIIPTMREVKKCLKKPFFDPSSHEGIYFSNGNHGKKTIKADRWMYKNERIINGGGMGEGLYGYDPLDSYHKVVEDY